VAGWPRRRPPRSWVSELTPSAALHWATGTAAPCTSLFKPFRFEQREAPEPAPNDRFDARTLWWRHERLHRLVMRDPEAAAPRFVDERDAVQERWLADPPDTGSALAEGDELLRRWTAAVAGVSSRDIRPAWVRRYWRVRDRRAGIRI
jgi:hypothetical protein